MCSLLLTFKVFCHIIGWENAGKLTHFLLDIDWLIRKCRDQSLNSYADGEVTCSLKPINDSF